MKKYLKVYLLLIICSIIVGCTSNNNDNNSNKKKNNDNYIVEKVSEGIVQNGSCSRDDLKQLYCSGEYVIDLKSNIDDSQILYFDSVITAYDIDDNIIGVLKRNDRITGSKKTEFSYNLDFNQVFRYDLEIINISNKKSESNEYGLGKYEYNMEFVDLLKQKYNLPENIYTITEKDSDSLISLINNYLGDYGSYSLKFESKSEDNGFTFYDYKTTGSNEQALVRLYFKNNKFYHIRAFDDNPKGYNIVSIKRALAVIFDFYNKYNNDNKFIQSTLATVTGKHVTYEYENENYKYFVDGTIISSHISIESKHV